MVKLPQPQKFSCLGVHNSAAATRPRTLQQESIGDHDREKLKRGLVHYSSADDLRVVLHCLWKTVLELWCQLKTLQHECLRGSISRPDRPPLKALASLRLGFSIFTPDTCIPRHPRPSPKPATPTASIRKIRKTCPLSITAPMTELRRTDEPVILRSTSLAGGP